MNLDPFQQEAAEQKNRYSVIIAGAGTGKTFTLLGRIRYLVKECGMAPKEIMVISYTNETVKEFSFKCQKILGFSVSVMTFHKLAMYLLELTHSFYQICDSNFLEYIVNEFMEVICMQNKNLQKSFFYSMPMSCRFSLKNRKKWKGDLAKQIINLIVLCKSKSFDEEFVQKLFQKYRGRKKHIFLITYVNFLLYESEKESQNYFDFDDIVVKAKLSISQIKKSIFPFRHILVDEFQDSSVIRIELLHQLVIHFDMDFTVVGDDCQSIYRFSGTESNCFKLLEHYFPNVSYYFLKYTYRNSQELVQVADQFVQKSSAQIKKEVLSFKHLSCPIEILYYRKKNSIYQMISYVIKQIPNSSILFLGRNSFDWKYYFQEERIQWIDQKHFYLKDFDKIQFTFLTVHQSKGLEADVVILLHVENSIYGFPNQMKPYFFHAIFFGKEQIKFEEERRLFYVALTRTKGKIFLVTPIESSSIFVNELVREHRKLIKRKYFF